jgi:flagellar basal body-associated protein FliL
MARKKAAEGEEAKGGGGKGKTMVVYALAAVGLLGGLKSFILGGGGKAAAAPAAAAATATTSTTKPGAVVTVGPITVNIAGDRFLKVGLGLQLKGGMVVPPHDSDDPSKGFARALDLTIQTFGGRPYDALVSAPGRQAARDELAKALEAAYPDQVEAVYFTDFVMQ